MIYIIVSNNPLYIEIEFKMILLGNIAEKYYYTTFYIDSSFCSIKTILQLLS